MAEAKAEPRQKVQSEKQAREDLGSIRTEPARLEREVALPFSSLSPDEFEVFCYLLLLKEQTSDVQEVFYYGKTGDAGRDIIRVFTDGRIELIQCKQSNKPVGIGAIRKELAKLCVNVFSGRIPGPKPDLVTFYVSSDLTSQALDLTRTQIMWQACAPTAISAHLKSAPMTGLLQFAKEWWPCGKPQIAIDLSERVNAFPALRDEFFTAKKVIDTAALDPVQEGLDRIEARQIMSAPQRMTEQLARLDAVNPGFEFSAEISRGFRKYSAKLKTGINEAELGKMVFPPTESGKRGLEKFQQFIDKGYETELLPGEAKFETALRLEDIVQSPKAGTITLGKNIPAREVPVRIECFDDDTLVASIPFARLKRIRQGRLEKEYELSGGQLAGCICLVPPSKDNRDGRFHVNFDPMSVTAENARNTVDLLLAAKPGTRVEVTALEEEMLVFGFWGFNEALDKDLFENARTFLDNLCVINSALELDLRYPEAPENHDLWLAEVMATGINNEGFVVQTPGVPVPMNSTKEALMGLLDHWSNGKSAYLKVSETVEETLVGQKLPPMEWLVEYGPLRAPGPVEELAELAEKMSPDDVTNLQLLCDRVVFGFPRLGGAASKT